MARLPWQHTRSRTKSGGEKTFMGNSQDWFNRHTTEPSRQALASLVKVHKRERSDESESSGSRSRSSTTTTSTEWQTGRSRAESTSDEAWSRPPSSLYVGEGSMVTNPDRIESSTRALLAKSGLMLRRTGSKMSLSSAGSSTISGVTSPSRHPMSNTTTSNTAARSEEIRSKISAPFDFQHVTHTEQTQFPGLCRIEEAELAHQFSALVTRQSHAPGLRGIEVSDMSTNDRQHHALTTDVLSAELNMPLPQLPSTSSGPTPPPKNENSQAYIVARCTPQKRSRQALRLSTSSPHSQRLSTTSTVELPSTPLDALSLRQNETARPYETTDLDLDMKPLPQLPVIHAVTTADGSARAMIAAPLPTPPAVPPFSDGEFFPKRPLHQRQQSSVALVRNMSFYPSTKTSMPDLLNSNRLSVLPRTLPRHHSDMALSAQAKDAQTRSRSRSSMSFGTVDTMNWEDAVDEAWDAADDGFDMNLGASQCVSFDSGYESSSNLLESFGSDDALSAVSTPLMMAPSRPLPPPPTERPSPSVGVESHKLESVQEDDHYPRMDGLGISSCPPSGTAPCTPQFSRSSSMRFPKSRSSFCGNNETLTRSSSQESIILSIASSIIGTQRSSSSSVSADDLMTICRIGEQSTPEDVVSEAERCPTVTKVRPESGCLPPDIYAQMCEAGASPSSPAGFESTTVSAVSPLAQHKYSKSASKVIVPERRSSIVQTDKSRSTRARSNTAGARPRQNTRTSYSLFPTGPSAHPALSP